MYPEALDLGFLATCCPQLTHLSGLRMRVNIFEDFFNALYDLDPQKPAPKLEAVGLSEDYSCFVLSENEVFSFSHLECFQHFLECRHAESLRPVWINVSGGERFDGLLRRLETDPGWLPLLETLFINGDSFI